MWTPLLASSSCLGRPIGAPHEFLTRNTCYFSPYHFRLLPRLFTERFRQNRRRPRATSLLIFRPTKETFTSRTKIRCLRPTNQGSQANLHRQVHVHAGIPYKSNHCMHACIITLKHSHMAMGMTLLQLPNSLSST